MDGFGLSPSSMPGDNAIAAANTPHLDQLFQENSCCRLSASGLDVGLPDGQMGNSEVGHTNIGAGRVVFQDLPRISLDIKEGRFFQNPAYVSAMDACKEKGTALHLMGLLSDGGVHSHIEHLFALLDMAKARGLTQVYVHCFLDGRDVPPTSGKGYVERLQAKLQELGVGRIATVMGRYYAMDRDSRWERLERAYAAMVYADAPFEDDPAAAVALSYERSVTDEFMVPVVCMEDATVSEGDSIIFFNFRPDRAREITRAFVDPEFNGFSRRLGYFPVQFVCTTEYDAAMPNVTVAYPREKLHNIFGEYLSHLGLTQLRIAETEKYAHVTFFFNGGEERVFPGEDRCLIPSPKVATYDLQPEMSEPEVTAEAVCRIESGKYDVVILNFANCDMVGHTGVFDAAVKAVEAVDECAGKVIEKALSMGGTVLLTADHGNADKMYEADGSPFTAHTTNPVPFLVISADERLAPGKIQLREGGRLADIAPTMLQILNLPQPAAMTGKSLLSFLSF